jgi:hypothetical protein
MKVRTLRIGLQVTLPTDPLDDGLTYSHRAAFEAEISVPDGLSPDAVVAALYPWVRWHTLACAQQMAKTHARVLDRGIEEFFQRHPQPPELPEGAAVRT